LTSQTRRLTNALKSAIKTMEMTNGKSVGMLPSELRVRRDQTAAVKSRFVEAAQRYAQVEQTHRQASKQRLERQYRIVAPGATNEEIKAAVEDAADGGQIFSQAVTSISPCMWNAPGADLCSRT
jgi:syntaxin 1B/2/3